MSDYLTENKERNKKGEFDKTDVLSVSGDYGIVNQIELLGRSFAGASVLPYHVVRHGNIVYTKSPLKEYPYGIVKANTGVDGIVSTLYAVYNIKNNVDAQFIEYYFSSANRTNRYFKPIVRIGAKHDMKIGNQEVLANKVTFPNLEEQTKIASLFRFLDERIATQNKIIEDLKKLKSAISHILFSSKGAIHLSEIANVVMGQSPSSNAYNDQGLGMPLVQGNLDISNGKTTPRLYTAEFNQTTEKGNIILTVRAPVGEVAKATQKVCLGRGVCAIIPHEENMSDFIYQYLTFYKFMWRRYEQGSTFTSINGSDVRNIFCPKVRNVSILTLLDIKINIEERVVKQYQSQKQYMLYQMFI